MKKYENWRKHVFNEEDPISKLFEGSLSELNTFLLDLFQKKSKSISASSLLKQFETNRFVVPSDIDPLKLLATEIQSLQIAKGHEFEPTILSPLAPLGSSSVLGPVNQNNIISALRKTEVVSDATNVLALKLASDSKRDPTKETIRKCATVHRHTRGQAFDDPKFSAHFSTFCMASSGQDPGNFKFESTQLQQHLTVIYEILLNYFSEEQLSLKFYLKGNSSQLRDALTNAKYMIWSNRKVEWVNDQDHSYYHLLQFKVYLKKGDLSFDLADGGFVDWTQNLLQNKKHRCMISGIGIELLHRILS